MPGGIVNQNHYIFQEEKMKKFWIVLIALGLVAAFSMSASAADVKFSGSYYIEGWYDDNHSLLDKADTSTTVRGPIALYHQRLRIQTDFKVAEGLALTTRFDALERNWGDRRERNIVSSNTAATLESVSRTVPAAAVASQEQGNIEFERVYITADLPFGRLIAGYAEDIAWGTDFLDTVSTRPQIKLIVPIGNFTLVGVMKKDVEGTMNNGYGVTNNSDKDIYDLAGVFKWKGGEAGLLIEYLNGQNANSKALNIATQVFGFFPYFKATLGPVFMEGEAYYGTGDWTKFDNVPPGATNVTLSTYGISLHAKVDVNPVYVGGRFIYMMGDDPNTLDKREGNIAALLVAGQAFLPCLMLFNDSYYTAVGTGYGGRAATSAIQATGPANGNVAANQFMDNVILGQLYAGVKPTPKWDVKLAATYATAQQKPNDAVGKAFLSNDYGWEFDLTASYKIYDNLTYMVGGGYLITGDYFKGSDANAKLSNDYILMHKLTLSF